MALPQIVWALIGHPKNQQPPLLRLYSTYEKALLAQLKIKLQSLFLVGDISRAKDLQTFLMNLPIITSWNTTTVEEIKSRLNDLNSEIRPTVVQISRWDDELAFVPDLFFLLNQMCNAKIPFPDEAEILVKENGSLVIAWLGTLYCSPEQIKDLSVILQKNFPGDINIESTEDFYDLVISPWSLPIEFIFELA